MKGKAVGVAVGTFDLADQGVQIVGAAYDEPAVMNVAAALEPAFGFQRPNI